MPLWGRGRSCAAPQHPPGGDPRLGGRQDVLLEYPSNDTNRTNSGKVNQGPPVVDSSPPPHVSQGQQQVLRMGTKPPELANNLPASMALCTGVLTSDPLARWAQKEGGRAGWKGSCSSVDGISWEFKDDLKTCGSYSVSAGTVPLQVGL